MNVNYKVFYVSFPLCSRLVQCDLRGPRLILTPPHSLSFLHHARIPFYSCFNFFFLSVLQVVDELREKVTFGLMSVNHWRVLLGLFTLFFTSTSLCGTEFHFCENTNDSICRYSCDCWTIAFSDFLGVFGPSLSSDECKKRLFKWAFTLFILG